MSQSDYEAFLAKSAARAVRAVTLGHGGEPRNSPSETEGAAKEQSEPLPDVAVWEEVSCVTCEADQHDALMKWANYYGIAYEHSRMDQATSGIVGTPDFYFMKNGKVVWVEMKFGKGKLSKAQEERQAVLKTCGIDGRTAWTIADAIAFVKEKILFTNGTHSRRASNEEFYY